MSDEQKVEKKQTQLFIEELPSCLYATKELLTLEDWQIRNLSEPDLYDVMEICHESFPLEYPAYWYKEVVYGKFISFGIFHCNKLTSLLVAEIKFVAECDTEVIFF